MHFTTLLTTLALASTAISAALPGTPIAVEERGTPIEERQSTPTVYGRFYPDSACGGAWVDDIVFAQSQTGCVNNSVTGAYKSTFFSGNTLTRTLRVYSLPGCPTNQGNYFDLLPGVNNCFAQTVGSAQFI